jgi:beta-phosphoglucomutase
MPEYIRAIIFDLDGVITDTAEYHFLAWKKLADEEGLPFTRADNEALRGLSRRDSLNRLLRGRSVPEELATAWMARKNGYYREMLSAVTPNDLLPGVADLLTEIRVAGIKIAIASASRNAPDVVARLGIEKQLDFLAHGEHVTRQKPAPDLFLFAARQLGISPAECLVVEDAQAGVEAAHAAGMVAVGLGPAERVGAAEIVLPNLNGIALVDLVRAATWRVCEPAFIPEKQNHRETIFTHGNGYLATRGTFEERFPGDSQATLVHGIWDDVPVSFTELANAPDWAALEIRINGQRFDMRAENIYDYARYLDLRTGVLHRRLAWSPSADCTVEIAFERFTSLDDEHLLVSRARVTPLTGSAAVSVRALLDAHVENEGILHWEPVSQASGPGVADLVVRTRHTGKLLAMSTRLTSLPPTTHLEGLDCPACPGVVLSAQVESGVTFSVEKITGIYSSRDTDSPLADAQTKAQQAVGEGYAGLLRRQVAAWTDFWDSSDVIIEGDDEAQLALRHALFQLRIAAPSSDGRVSLGAKTLSGFGYRGHVFWDNEIFVLPFFIYTQPAIARNMLLYRFHALPGARRKATANGFAGAQFPWESAETGDEVTPTWVPHFADPARLVRIWTGDIQIHISADVAYAMHQYWRVSGDDHFWREVGIPVLLETAVFWGERAEQEGDSFAIRDVIGPDENHDHVDNNQYTNHMVRWHLQTALACLHWLSAQDMPRLDRLVSELNLTPERLDHWQRLIDGLVLLHDQHTGLIEQYEGFFALKDVDWSAFAGRTKSMQEILGIEGCTEYKALKQADVIALLCLLGDQFNEKTWEANWKYYVPITDHEYGSSLGPSMHAWAACRMKKTEDAYAHFMRAARADLLDVRGNAGDGIHAASAGGLWEACIFGFAGMRLTGDGLTFNPKLPSHWKRMAFNIIYRGKRQHVDLRQAD